MGLEEHGLLQRRQGTERVAVGTPTQGLGHRGQPERHRGRLEQALASDIGLPLLCRSCRKKNGRIGGLEILKCEVGP